MYEGAIATPEDQEARDRRRVGPRSPRCCSWRRPPRTRATTQATAVAVGIRRRGLHARSRRCSTELTRGARRGAAARGGRVAPRTSPRFAALLAQQPPWSDLPVLVLTRPGADSAESGEAVADARQRDAARAAVRVRDAAERGAHRAARPRAPVSDSRAPRRARPRRGIAAARRSAQGRVPGDARPRAAQPAGAAADRLSSC